MAKGGAKKILYEDYVEKAEQARYFYGKLHTDKICSYCENVIEYEYQSVTPCHLCGEHGWLIDCEENV